VSQTPSHDRGHGNSTSKPRHPQRRTKKTPNGNHGGGTQDRIGTTKNRDNNGPNSRSAEDTLSPKKDTDRNTTPRKNKPQRTDRSRHNSGNASEDTRQPRNTKRLPSGTPQKREKHQLKDNHRKNPAWEERLWTRDGRPARGDRAAKTYEDSLNEEQQRARQLRSVRPRHEDPDISDDVHPHELDKIARNELKTLSKENADWVAQHLVMAARLINKDPEMAHRHAISAARRAGRIPVVRETLAITAYSIGNFSLALRELRTYRRISGSNEQVPLMVDSERGRGQAGRALELGRSVDRSTLSTPTQVALAIAMSGARLDRGQPEAALVELQIPQLNPDRAFSWSPDLFTAYAHVLTELGRDADAQEWFAFADRADEALTEQFVRNDNDIESDGGGTLHGETSGDITDSGMETIHVIEEELIIKDGVTEAKD
jgi:hypothetical protein